MINKEKQQEQKQEKIEKNQKKETKEPEEQDIIFISSSKTARSPVSATSSSCSSQAQRKCDHSGTSNTNDAMGVDSLFTAASNTLSEPCHALIKRGSETLRSPSANRNTATSTCFALQCREKSSVPEFEDENERNKELYRNPGNLENRYQILALGVEHLAPTDRKITSDEKNSTILNGDPFRKVSKLSRTPPQSRNGSNMGCHLEPETPKNTLPMEKTSTTESKDVKRAGKYEKKSEYFLLQEINKCIDAIQKMKVACKKQKNISMDIKNGLSVLEETIDEMSWHLKKIEKTAKCAVQPRVELEKEDAQVKNRTNGEKTEQNKLNPTIQGQQKRRPTSPLPKEQNKRTKNAIMVESSIYETNNVEKQILPPVANADQRSYAQTLKAKNSPQMVQASQKQRNITQTANNPKKKEKWQRRSRPEAILLHPTGQGKYSDILKEIRTKVNPEETETVINAIRQTKSGDVLLKLGAKTKDKEAFSKSLESILGDKATVRQLEHKITIEIRDLDALTTVEEVEEALRKNTKNSNLKIKVGMTETNRSALKMAIISLNAETANELLKLSKIKVGWVQCRIRRRVEVPRCFKCFGYGHQQGTCRNKDRKGQGLCLQCGEKGHKKAECKNQMKCCLCSDLKNLTSALDHLPGSGKCQVFRDALEKEKRKLQ